MSCIDRCLPVCVLGILALGIIGTTVSGCKVAKYSAGLERAAIWDAPASWEEVPCKVLSAGVACTEKDTGGTCGGYLPGHLQQNFSPYVFDTQDIAACPGTYYCSKEGELCSCKGDVTYATRVFNGQPDSNTPYEMDQLTNPSYTIASDGTALLCGNGEGSAFPDDPTPGWVKHCWCTPDVIKTLIAGGSPLRKERCSEVANQDYAAARELAPATGPGQEQETSATASDAVLELGEAVVAEKARDEMDERRLATVVADARRRRTFSYTPWALVEIDGPADTKQLSCAYEFGSTAASYGEYQSDGTYGGDVWQVESLVKDWASPFGRMCYARSAGSAAEGRCAMAMSSPGSMGERRQDDVNMWSRFLWFSIALSILALLCGCGIVALSSIGSKASGSGDDESELLSSD